ncbi:MAG TPA: type II toxin-antitoxin system VapB family antitoxin [Thermoanaerobaculia bacterium]|nr:type II toxin-antitoxin system VapB family antitoxin [Thermoanaerobaculia bacterium]
MAINIKNERVERLADELARITGESKTAVILRALEERRERLATGASGAARLPRVIDFLEKEIWPTVPPNLLGRGIRRDERERILGYRRKGV